MSFTAFMRELHGVRVEGELIKTISYSLLTGIITLAVLYVFRLKSIEKVTDTYGFFLLLAVCSYALLSVAIHQVRAYREMPCMAGMMVGMTIGMIAGFLPGFYVASTNGMFVGSVFGMVIGICLGIWNGRCCGVMGVMEGVMAGFMGGLMGAMTAFMLLNDNLRAAAVIVFLISALILISLNYMIYKEMREIKTRPNKEHLFAIAFTFIMTVITIWLMVFGPRSTLFG